MYVVYNKPLDYPNKVVVRRFVVDKGEVAADKEPFLVVNTFAAARALRPMSTTILARNPEDEPHIVEVWV